MNRQQAVHLDLILQTLVDKKIKAGSVELVNQNLLPDQSPEYCLSLYHMLLDHHPRLLWPTDDISPHYFRDSDYTPAFLHDGGYTAMFDRENEKQLKEASRQSLQDQKLESDLKFSLFQSSKGIKISKISIVIAILAFIISVWKIPKELAPVTSQYTVDSVALKQKFAHYDSLIQILERKSEQSNSQTKK